MEKAIQAYMEKYREAVAVIGKIKTREKLEEYIRALETHGIVKVTLGDETVALDTAGGAVAELVRGTIKLFPGDFDFQKAAILQKLRIKRPTTDGLESYIKSEISFQSVDKINPSDSQVVNALNAMAAPLPKSNIGALDVNQQKFPVYDTQLTWHQPNTSPGVNPGKVTREIIS